MPILSILSIIYIICYKYYIQYIIMNYIIRTSSNDYDNFSDINVPVIPAVQKVQYSRYGINFVNGYPYTNNAIVNSPVISFTPAPINRTFIADVNTGLNDNAFAQEQMTQYLLKRVTHHWMRKSEMKKILKYMILDEKRHVRVVKNREEYDNNDISNDSHNTMEKKSEYVQKNVLGKKEMRKILIQIMDELRIPWKQLSGSAEEKIVISVSKKYIKRKFKKYILKHSTENGADNSAENKVENKADNNAENKAENKAENSSENN